MLGFAALIPTYSQPNLPGLGGSSFGDRRFVVQRLELRFFPNEGQLTTALRAGLRMGAAKPRRPVGLASLRSVPVHDGAELVEERQRRLAPLRRAACVAPGAERP